MKHIFKPVGHCLATAVMTSTLLRVFPASIAEAATPEAPLPPSSEEAHQSSEDPAPAIAVAPPTAPVTVESIVVPEVSGAVSETVSGTVGTASGTASGTVSGTVSPSTPAPSPAAQPDANPIVAPATPAPSPAAQTGSQGAAPQTEQKNAAKPAPAKQAPASQPQTLEAMRQQIDQRLAAIVERDRATREAQLQQNLITIALGYAEAGDFEPAREVARHPALPPELQTTLLAQIDEIAAKIPAQPGDQPGGQSAVAAVPAPAAETPGSAGGRVVPLHSVVNLPASQSWAGTSILPQCPASDTATAQPAVQVRPIVQDKFQASRLGSQVAATLAAAIERSPASSANSSPSAPSEAAKPAIVQPEAAKPETALSVRPPALQSGSPVAEIAQPETNPGAAKANQARSLAVPEIGSVANREGDRSINPPSNFTFTGQPVPGQYSAAASRPLNGKANLRQASVETIRPGSSPLELMSYWVSKPLKEAGIRLPFFPALSNNLESDNLESDYLKSGNLKSDNLKSGNLADTLRSDILKPNALESNPSVSKLADEAQTKGSSAIGRIEAEPASPSVSDLMQELSSDPLQPAMSLRPYLLDFKKSVVDVQFAVKDAVKLSPPAASLPPAQSVSQKTPVPQAANCFSPVADSTYVTISPALSRQMGWKDFAFPLSIPAVLTSSFGWRVHPISGDRRFHAGVDLGAPMGTPVIAAAPGRVVAADDMGGYGLAVVVETTGGHYRNLYAHLSGIAVRPGTAVQQGSVLGWVGSTGNSTGPHLHFETLIPTSEGWTAIDPLSAAAEAIASRAVGE